MSYIVGLILQIVAKNELQGMIALTTPAAQCADDCGENRYKKEGVQRKEYRQQGKNFSGSRLMHTNDTKNKSRQCRKETTPESRIKDD